MTDQRLGLRVSAIIFAIFCLGHLVRIATHLELRIGDRLIPMWPSAVAVLVAGFLCVWFWRLSKAGGSS